MQKEACVESLSEAIAACRAGANRLELCSRLDLDGLTPSEKLIEAVLENVPLPIRVMIRVRGGDFCFSEKEIQQSEEQILFCKNVSVRETIGNLEGVVFGFLKTNNTIDIKNTRRLAQLAHPLKVVFHKAIDLTPDISESVKTLATIPEVTDILTSGGMPTALEGSHTLNTLVEQYHGRLNIISAGKVTPDNLESLNQKIGGEWYHGRRIV